MTVSIKIKRMRSVFGILLENPGLTIPEIAAKATTKMADQGLLPTDGHAHVREMLLKLQSQGDVRHEGEQWAGRRWFVTEKAFADIERRRLAREGS